MIVCPFVPNSVNKVKRDVQNAENFKRVKGEWAGCPPLLSEGGINSHRVARPGHVRPEQLFPDSDLLRQLVHHGVMCR